jgi:L-2-hydroxyglutarate oxidase LhgO
MSTDFDAVVIGAGVIGLAIARELALGGRSVLVLEKNSGIGLETSSRNSEVIHAGIYYPKDSLKGRFCVDGRELLYDYCSSRGVSAKRIGKLIVATSFQEEAKLNTILAAAHVNGVKDLRVLSQSEAREIEPEVLCTKALFSPSTGIVDSSAYLLALQGDAETMGAGFAFNVSFVNANRPGDHWLVQARDEQGGVTDITSLHLFNCAGHGGHEAARAVAGYDPTHLPPQFFARGNYCSVSGASPFKHLVYPVPVPGALGIHSTLDMGGAVRFGPDIQWIDKPDYALPLGLPEKFASAVSSYWPAVQDRELTPTYCGIRPKIHGPQSGFADFLIQDETQHGLPGLVNFFGIESPGLTSSLAIAKVAVQKSLLA